MPKIPSNQKLARRVLVGYFAALTELDPQAIASLFAAAGVLEDPLGTPIRRGRAAIEEYWASGLCRVADRVEIETIAVLPSGRGVAAHWRMTAHADGGRQAQAEGIDVLRFDDDGLILRAEGYWDQQAFRRALAG